MVKFVLDRKAVRNEILNSNEVLNECEKFAKEKAKEAYGNEFHMKVFKGTERAHAMAFPNTKRNPE